MSSTEELAKVPKPAERLGRKSCHYLNIERYPRALRGCPHHFKGIPKHLDTLPRRPIPFLSNTYNPGRFRTRFWDDEPPKYHPFHFHRCYRPRVLEKPSYQHYYSCYY